MNKYGSNCKMNSVGLKPNTLVGPAAQFGQSIKAFEALWPSSSALPRGGEEAKEPAALPWQWRLAAKRRNVGKLDRGKSSYLYGFCGLGF